MIEKIIYLALRNRMLIIVGLVGLISFGIYAYKKIPVDAFPDVTNVQVQIITEAPGMSPLEVEQFVTYPLEVQMTGLPKVTDIRSLSKFGLSMVTVVFEDNVDIYFARQLVLERVIEAKEKLPEGIEPHLGPISTGLGEVYQYTLEKPNKDTLTTEELMELRTIQDWIVRPILKTVHGVADVNAFGGFVKQYQVLVKPENLKKYNVSLKDVFDAVAKNNANAAGNIIEKSSEQYMIRGIGLIKSITELGNIVVKIEGVTPIFVKDLAELKFGPETRHGAVVKDAKGEGVAGIVLMLKGESGKEVVKKVKEKVAEINKSGVLPDNIQIKPFYDRTELVEKSINTVSKALLEGAFLVLIILYLFLRNIRGAIVVAVTLPLAVLATFIVMWRLGITANLMSLGGLAISLGMIVDAAVIQVENVQRHLAEKGISKAKILTVFDAVLEVRKPSLFGELIIAITFIPIMTLQGMEGKMFGPLAFTVVIAILSSLLLSIFVIPVLCSYFLRESEEKESIIIRWVKKYYLPMLHWAMDNTKKVIFIAGILLISTLLLIPFLGTEFIPSMDEGSLTPQIIRLPSVSLSESVEIEKKAQQALLKFPEVETVVSKIGAAEIATDPMGPNISDPIVVLKPKKYWKTARTKEELIEKIRAELEKIPGIGLNMTQPIALRVDELISGVKSQIAIKIFGDDMDILKKKAEEIAKVVSTVKGVADLRVEQTSGQPYLNIDIDRNSIARHGINVEDVKDIIEIAIGGKEATKIIEGDRRFSVVLRFPEDRRNSIENIKNITVKTSSGAYIPLAQLAHITLSDGPVQISRENGKRRIVIECNVSGRDIGGFVADAKSAIDKEVKLPSGYYIGWGGAFENQQRAMKRLMIIVPMSICLIFFLLYLSFTSFKHAGLIMLTLPFSLIGGVFGLFISKHYLSVPASVGFISLFGVAVLNGMVLISYINKLRQEGKSLYDAIFLGCELRLRPVLMTATVAILGLIPLLFATGPGSEVQKPLAIVMVGGLLTSTFMTLIVLPAIYKLIEKEN